MLTTLVVTMRSAGIEVALAELRRPVIDMARRSGLLARLGEDRFFHTIDEAVETLDGRSGAATRHQQSGGALMGQAIGQVLSFGIGVALSPVPIIAVVLTLATPKGRGTGPAFLAAWIVGLARGRHDRAADLERRLGQQQRRTRDLGQHAQDRPRPPARAARGQAMARTAARGRRSRAARMDEDDRHVHPSQVCRHDSCCLAEREPRRRRWPIGLSSLKSSTDGRPFSIAGEI